MQKMILHRSLTWGRLGEEKKKERCESKWENGGRMGGLGRKAECELRMISSANKINTQPHESLVVLVAMSCLGHFQSQLPLQVPIERIRLRDLFCGNKGVSQLNFIYSIIEQNNLCWKWPSRMKSSSWPCIPRTTNCQLDLIIIIQQTKYNILKFIFACWTF